MQEYKYGHPRRPCIETCGDSHTAFCLCICLPPANCLCCTVLLLSAVCVAAIDDAEQTAACRRRVASWLMMTTRRPTAGSTAIRISQEQARFQPAISPTASAHITNRRRTRVRRSALHACTKTKLRVALVYSKSFCSQKTRGVALPCVSLSC